MADINERIFFIPNKSILLYYIFILSLVKVTTTFPYTIPCDQYFIGTLGSGVITHHNYPFNYTERLNCHYRIFIPYIPPRSKWRICFQFRRFSLADSDICSDDYLRFPDWYTYCGAGRAMPSKPASDPMNNIFYSQLCWPLTSKQSFEITFNSRARTWDSTNWGTNLGFYADYEILDAADTVLPPCDGNQTENCSIIAAPRLCSKNEFRCFDSLVCIEKSLVCDGISQCIDGSDESYTHARCPTEQNIEACSFDTDMCGLTTVTGWYRGQHFPSGLARDHTFQEQSTGYFLYSDYTHTDVANAKYVLVDPINGTESRCLSFYYLMMGVVGRLRVQFKMKEGWANVWVRDGRQSTDWLQGDILIPGSAFPVTEITFEVTNNANTINNIGLDDISLKNGYCFSNDVSCTFEMDYCNWRPHLSVTGKWTRHRGPTTTHQTGPPMDHTSLGAVGGYYVYFNASDHEPGEAARLVSRSISHGLSTERYVCLQFWFHMNGLGMGQLRVHTLSHDGSRSQIWEKSGDQVDHWIQAVIPFRSLAGPFQLLFEAVRGPSKTSDIALDDIQLTPGYCDNSPTSSPSRGDQFNQGKPIPVQPRPPGFGRPPSFGYEDSAPPTSTGCINWGEFRCVIDGICLPGRVRCDNHFHCPDRSDEMNCPKTARSPEPSTSWSWRRRKGNLFRRSTTMSALDRQGGPLWSYEDRDRQRSPTGVATSVVIGGATLGCVILLVIVIMSVVLIVKRHSLARCIHSRNARNGSTRQSYASRRSHAPHQSSLDTVDQRVTNGEDPPPYMFAPYKDPPPYSVDIDRYSFLPPAYELVPLNSTEAEERNVDEVESGSLGVEGEATGNVV